MDNCKTVVFAPHDDGSGAFGVLCRLARALIRVADKKGCRLSLYFLNSSVTEHGQETLDHLLRETDEEHKAVFVPTDNLIWLPKDPNTATVAGAQIPDMLRKWVRPLWYSWPCEPNWIRQDLPMGKGWRDDWMRVDIHDENDATAKTWREVLSKCGTLRDLTSRWGDVALGISMGVPQLHRVARREGFPSIEVGDWFFSIGLRGCMRESFVPPEVIATAEADLGMIEEDEFKAREIWITLHQAPREAYMAHVAKSPVRFREMTKLLWTGNDHPDVVNWPLANDLRKHIDADIANIRDDTKAEQVAYIVPGYTPVWNGILEKLEKKANKGVAILGLDRGKKSLTLLEKGGRVLKTASAYLSKIDTEEMHLATCRACDFGVTRTAGGVLGFAETQRPSVLVDEPGHWLGRIQRDQCRHARLCVVLPIDDFLENPADCIQDQADKLGTNSDLDQTVTAAQQLELGAEVDLAEYLFKTYIK